MLVLAVHRRNPQQASEDDKVCCYCAATRSMRLKVAVSRASGGWSGSGAPLARAV